ncbi:MAG: hypothetical protein OEQ39_12800, partial [Gammaproteobacteria bacterium]|nr:hypothetical protein [Gammaproteobacteria bacterium]
SPGPNEDLNGGNSFVLSAAQQVTGTNVIEFRQTTPGFRWGVTGLLLEDFQPDTTLLIDVPDGGQSNVSTTTFTATFASAGVDLQISAIGHDIDATDEVGIYVNGILLGYLGTGLNNGPNNGNVFVVQAGQQIPGTNVLVFRQKTSGETWGVTDLLLEHFLPDVTLTLGTTDVSSYGHNYGLEVGSSLTAAFQTAGTDVQLSVLGYDIDFPDEVGVYLNGNLLFHIQTGATDALNGGDVRLIPLEQQAPGTNVLEFRQQTASETWGVTNLLVDSFQPDVTLSVGTEDAGSYGHNFGTEVDALLIAVFENSGTDLQLSVTGYDIDFPDEVAMYLNGGFQGHLSVGPDNGLNSGDVFMVLASQQIAGTNIVEFRQTTPGFRWGVTDLLLGNFLPDVTLDVGMPASGPYGHNFGTEVDALLIAAFPGRTSDLVVSATGYDIDFVDEVSVHLNGTLLGYLSPGPNEDLNGGNSFVLSAAQQVTGTNVIEFRQTTPGFRWGVTGLQLQNFQPDVTLFLDQTETGQFGHDYGNSLNETLFTAAFEGTTSNLQLSLNGYDIDVDDEISVYVNDDLLGHLIVGPNDNLNNGDIFLIPAAQQRVGTNVLELRQKAAAETWGITNLLLETFQPDASLVVGTPDAGQSNITKTIFTAAFDNTGVDLQLSVTGHDIDAADEVVVFLNRNLVGYLSVGPDNGINGGDMLLIREAEQIPATNIIEFRQKSAGETWGATTILLDNFQPDVTLTVGSLDAGTYGHNYGIEVGDLLTTAFQSTGSDLQLSVDGYDIDTNDEVAIHLNGSFLFHLRVGPDSGLNAGDTRVISLSQQVSGTNIIEFRQKTSAETWGVTSLLLDNFQPNATLNIGVEDPGSYGHNYGTEVNALMVASFQGTDSDLQLSVTGYDIDFPDEVAVHLNGEFRGYLRTGANNKLNAGDIFMVLASQQVSGTNVIEFRQTTPGFRWGVTDLVLDNFQPDVTLILGNPDGGSYGHNYGAEVGALLTAAFQGTGGDPQLSVTGYDIDFVDEVGVYLNGSFLGYLSQGPNNNLNAGDSFVLPAGQQLTGTNVIEFRQKNPKWKWGATSLLLSP